MSVPGTGPTDNSNSEIEMIRVSTAGTTPANLPIIVVLSIMLYGPTVVLAQDTAGGSGSSADALQDQLDDQKQQLDESLQQGMRLTLDDHAQQLSDVRGEFVEAFQNVSEHFSSQMTSWQMLLKDATDAATDQLAEMRKYREAILANAQQEEQLIRLESRLCDNLEAVRAAETFEQTLHSLNAAVHLLTARTGPKAA